jgi:WD40 repeat protein
MARVFISHSSKDSEQAARLLEWLRAQRFETAFLDFDKHAGIPPGADWERTLYREIARAEAMLIVFTKNWLDSKWCFAEFTQARALGKAIFPLIESPAGDTFVAPDIQHLDLLADRDGGLQRLSAELTRLALNARGEFPWDAMRPPFPGLLAYDEADAAIYFGRDDDIRRLIERLNARRAQGGAKLVALLGASGSGKSSLMRAGVLPRLKRDRRNWIVLPPFRPQTQPLDELAAVLAQALGAGGDWRKLRATLMAENLQQSLGDLARDLRVAHAANDAQILVSIDQGEELFGAADKANAERFFAVLDAMLAEPLPFMALLGMPSYYLGPLQQAPGLAAPFEEFSLKPLALERLREIIEGTARMAGLEVENAFPAVAMRDAATDDALPLLAFALRELYERFGRNALTVASYRALGDAKEEVSPLENAVRQRADQALAEAKPAAEQLQALREAFVPAMVRVNAEGDYVRRPARIDLLPAPARPLLERLAKARLLTLRHEGGETVVEVAHEALLRKWPLLRGWLDEQREFLIGKQQLEHDLHDWQKSPEAQKSDALLSGLKLTRARAWLIAKPRQLSEPERAYIGASIARQEAEAARRERARRSVLVGSVAASLVLLIAAGAAAWQWRVAALAERAAEEQKQVAIGEKARAQAREYEALVTQSRSLADLARQRRESGDDATAILLSLEALPDSGLARPYVPRAELQLDAAIRTVRERKVLAGHEHEVLSAAFRPDGKRVVTASADKTARIWDAETGQAIGAPLRGHGDIVASAAFSPNGKRIVTASWDKTAQIWDAESGRPIGALRGHKGEVNSAAFSPDGKNIVTASFDGTARIWDAKTGQTIGAPLHGHEGAVNSAAFSPDGRRIVTASRDGTARIWDVETRQPIGAPLRGHEGDVYSATFSPDGKRIVTASADKTARLWDAGTGQRIGAPYRGHAGAVSSAAFSPDGKRIVTASADKTAHLWDADTGKPLAAPLGAHERDVMSAVFKEDGKRIVTASRDKTARLWDAETGQTISVELRGHDSHVQGAAFNSNGKHIVTASADTTARLWDAETGDPIGAPLKGHTSAVNSAAFSPDGRRIITASSDGTARLWDVKTFLPVGAPLRGHEGSVRSAAFSPDGKRIVTASLDKTARLWDADTLLPIGLPLRGHEEEVYSAAFSPEGRRIVTASLDKTVRLWDAGSRQPIGEPLRGHNGAVYSAAFDPDGRRLVTASGDKTARRWDVATQSIGIPLRGHDGYVNSAAFSPDGKRIVTASWDKTARLWDAESGETIAELRGHAAPVNRAAFSPDGKRIVTASDDKTARVWVIFPTTQALVDEAKKLTPRCLTLAQRETFFLSTAPPAWCIDLEKWPYHTQAWKDWLRYTRAGLKPPLPETLAWQIFDATEKEKERKAPRGQK